MPNNGYSAQQDWVRSALVQYEDRLTRYACRITGDAERARDVVQETFLSMCRQERERIDGRLSEWLYTVCRNKALDVRRKERRMAIVTEQQLTKTETSETSPPEVAERNDSTSWILELIGELPDSQQEVIGLKFHGGLSYREISKITGLSVSNVGFLIHRGIKTVRERAKRIR